MRRRLRSNLDLNTTSVILAGNCVSGFVDGAASNARFRTLHGAVSPDGTMVYVADSGNNAIRLW